MDRESLGIISANTSGQTPHETPSAALIVTAGDPTQIGDAWVRAPESFWSEGGNTRIHPWPWVVLRTAFWHHHVRDMRKGQVPASAVRDRATEEPGATPSNEGSG